ncbi:MAG: DNA polymerase III subunit delta' [Firmicutes bacterium]|nr:DNA polymerase III subunit delta' [Bacillota bacterium]MCL5040772.1 DNA polymerase III subunit delta' [Bacillota bacterium]
MALRDLVGQDRVVDFLLRSKLSGRVAHAYLFYGPGGVGKGLAAVNFAKALNCQETGPDACDSCDSCRRIEDGTHPGVERVAPSGAHIRIDQVRRLRRETGFQHLHGRYRVYLLEEAEKMTPEATNALLKTLEEPPPNMVFLLVTEAPWSIPPTVVSRCQPVPFRTMAPRELEEVLKGQWQVDSARARIISLLAGGRLGRALELKDSPALLQVRTAAEDFIRKMMAQDALAALETAAALEKKGAVEFLEALSSLYRDLLVWRVTGEASLLENIDRLGFFEEMGGGRPQVCLDEDIQAIERTLRFLARNINRRLALEVLFLGLRNRTGYGLLP